MKKHGNIEFKFFLKSYIEPEEEVLMHNNHDAALSENQKKLIRKMCSNFSSALTGAILMLRFSDLFARLVEAQERKDNHEFFRLLQLYAKCNDFDFSSIVYVADENQLESIKTYLLFMTEKYASGERDALYKAVSQKTNMPLTSIYAILESGTSPNRVLSFLNSLVLDHIFIENMKWETETDK